MQAERGAAPAGPGLVSRAPGRPRVTVRPYYGGPPLVGWTGPDERGESPGIRGAKSPLSGPGSTVPRPKIAAVKRRKARRSAEPAVP